MVAHFHYVLSMGAVFAIFAAFYFWAPKIMGKTYNDFLGKLHFWTMFVGVLQDSPISKILAIFYNLFKNIKSFLILFCVLFLKTTHKKRICQHKLYNFMVNK